MTSRLPHLTRVAGPAALALLVLAGCGSSDDGSSDDGSSSAGGTSASANAQVAQLGAADSSLGKIVVDGKRMTAYYFTKDAPNSGKSACTGECLQAWPPITTTSTTPAASGVTGELGTITLPDGSRQVTVNGRPVYLFAKDTKPGDVLGQGVGSVWYVLRPDGTMVTDQPAVSGGY